MIVYAFMAGPSVSVGALFMAGVVVVILLAIYLPIIQTISSGPMSGR